MVLAVILMVTIGLGSGISLIKFNADMESFLPEDNEALMASNILVDEFGGQSYENILIKGDVTSLEAITSLIVLEQTIMSDPQLQGVALSTVSYIDMLISTGAIPAQIDEQTPHIVRQILENDKASEQRQIIGQLVSEDFNATLMLVQIEELSNDDDMRAAIEHLQDVVSEYDENNNTLTAGVTGTYTIMYDTLDSMGNDNVVLMTSAALFIILVLIIFFRKISDVILPFVTIGISLIWILGIMGFIGIPFTVMLVMLLPLLLGISINYAIHVIYRYKEERFEGKSVVESINACVKNTGTAVFVSAITTVFGFSSFAVAELVPMQQFGILSVFGIIFAFLLVVTLLPAFMVLRDRRSEKAPKKVFDRGITSTLDRLVTVAIHHKRPVLIVVVIATLCSISAAPFVDTSINWNDMTPKDIDSIVISSEISESFSNPYENRITVLVEGDVYSPEIMAEVAALTEQFRSIDSLNEDGALIIESPYSVTSYVDYLIQANNGELPATKEQAQAIVQGLLADERMSQVIAQYIILDPESQRYNELGIIGISANAVTDKDMSIISDDIYSITDTGISATYKPAGALIVMADILGGMTSTQIKTTFAALLLCFFAVALISRSGPFGALAILPVFLTISWELLLLYLMGWAFDLFTVMISALIVGLGIDFSVHIIQRFREEVASGHTTEEAIHGTVTNVGKALVTATITTGGAFFIVGLSSMPILARFGILTGIVLVFSFVASMIVLPPILAWYNDRKNKSTA